MAIIKPFKGIRPPKELVEQVDVYKRQMLGQAATAAPGASELINVNGTPATMWDMVVGCLLYTSRCV